MSQFLRNRLSRLIYIHKKHLVYPRYGVRFVNSGYEVSNTHDYAKNEMKDMKNAMKETNEHIKQDAKQGYNDMKEKAHNINNAMKDQTEDIKATGKATGQYIKEKSIDMKDKLKDKAEDLKDRAKDIKEDIKYKKDAAKSTTGTTEPRIAQSSTTENLKVKAKHLGHKVAEVSAQLKTKAQEKMQNLKSQIQKKPPPKNPPVNIDRNFQTTKEQLANRGLDNIHAENPGQKQTWKSHVEQSIPDKSNKENHERNTI